MDIYGKLCGKISAINANTLKVTFNQAADVEDVELAVTRGTTKVAGTFKWSEENKVATFEADGKLVKGTYTVTATSKADADFKATGTVEVTDQKTAKIVIENDVALTSDEKGQERKQAFAFYDVVDQYGESVRATTNITWTASVKEVKADRTTGQLTLTKGDGNEFMFNEKVYITGVDTKNGISVQKELTIGQARSLDTLEIAGFVKKGTSKIVEELPAGFKAGEYSMVFEALDQNGNVYPADKVSDADVTFVSDNPLLIEKASEEVTKLVIDGVDYSAVEITPGMNLDKGGEVNITAIAKKTGKQTVKNIVVGDVAILDSFEMLDPSGIIAEGEIVEIPFEAKAGGQEITNFTTLARKAGINELKLNKPSTGSLILKENNDGTAKLLYIPDPASYAWDKSETTDGLDRPVSLTTVVVGGNASNIMLNVADKARPVGIKSVDFDNTLVEKGETTITLSKDATNSFTFVDQYGREMTKELAYEFFEAAEEDKFQSGTELKDYKYSIKATYKGEDGVFKVNNVELKNKDAFEIKAAASNNTLTLVAEQEVTGTAKSNMALDFEIIRYNKAGTANFKDADFDYTPVSSKKNVALTVVDITAVKNFEVKELPRLQVVTSNSQYPTGATIDGELKDGMTTKNAGSLEIPAKKEVKVTADYNGKAVTIPADYLTLESNQLNIDGDNKITNVKDYVAASSGTTGSPEVRGVNQVVTITVSGTATQGGDITISDGTNNVKVAVAENDDEAAVAEKIRTAIDNDSSFIFSADTTETGATVTLTADEQKDDVTITFADADPTTGVTVSIKTTINGKAAVPAVPATSATPQQGFTWGDFYDAKTANFLRKDAKATVTAKVYKGEDKAPENMINTAKRTILLSDAKAVATTIEGPETLTVNPNTTNITVAANIKGAYKVLDQYGEDFTADNISYKAINVEENKDGYVDNNFKVTKNDTTELAIEGAERGDTFTLELRSGDAKKTVKVTVGADLYANITNGDNNYLKKLIGDEKGSGLESQRLNSLK